MGKETVLALLLREKGRFVSGEAISAELGITRAAIWKSISALRAQGYEIEAVPGRGYCLKALPDVLNEQTVRSFLGGVQVVGGRIDCFDTIDSTNAYLKRIAFDGAPDGTVAVAAEQTSGRGRRGRTFQSAAGKGVYLSVLLRPELTPAQLMPLTGLVAVAMSRAVDRVGGTNVQIKWTNDLVLGKKKLCGILTELSVSLETQEPEYVVIGIGINVFNDVASIAGEIKDPPARLADLVRDCPSLHSVMASLGSHLNQVLSVFSHGGVSALQEGLSRAWAGERPVSILTDDETVRGIFTGIDDQGNPVLSLPAGAVRTIPAHLINRLLEE